MLCSYPWSAVEQALDNQWYGELVLLDKEVNNIKEGFWGKDPARYEYTLQDYAGWGDALFKNVKDTIVAIRYHMDPTIRGILIAQKNRVGDMLNQLETHELPSITKNIDGVQRTWASLGLQAKWNTFMRGRAAEAITKSKQHVDDYLDMLKEGYATPGLGEQWRKRGRRADKEGTDCED